MKNYNQSKNDGASNKRTITLILLSFLLIMFLIVTGLISTLIHFENNATSTVTTTQTTTKGKGKGGSQKEGEGEFGSESDRSDSNREWGERREWSVKECDGGSFGGNYEHDYSGPSVRCKTMTMSPPQRYEEDDSD